MSFILLLLYFFCIFIRPQDWISMFYQKPLVIGIVIAAFICLVLERLFMSKQGFTKVPQNKLLTGFYLAILLSHASHTYFGGMISSFNLFLIVYLSYFLILNCVGSYFKMQGALWFMVVLIVSLVFQGMYQLENGYGWAGQPPYITGQLLDTVIRIKWVGIFSDPNDLALAFVMAAGIMMAFVFGKTGFFTRITSFVLLGILLYGIYLTNSRGGLLAFMVTTYFFFVRRTKTFLFGGILGGVLASIFLIFGPSRMGLISTTEASAHGRVELWYQGILMIKSNPLFGVGHNMFMADLPQTAHNSFILAASELGMFGLFFWMGLIYISIKGLSMVQNKDPKLYNCALGLQSSLVGFCAAAFFLSRTYIILPYILFAFSGAAMGIAKAHYPELEFKLTKKDYRNIVGLSFGVLFLAYFVIKVGL